MKGGKKPKWMDRMKTKKRDKGTRKRGRLKSAREREDETARENEKRRNGGESIHHTPTTAIPEPLS